MCSQLMFRVIDGDGIPLFIQVLFLTGVYLAGAEIASAFQVAILS